MSKVYPTKCIGEKPGFEIGDPAKFHAFLERHFWEQMIHFRRMGRDLMPHLPPLPEVHLPDIDDIDRNGNRIYTLALTRAAVGDEHDLNYQPAVYGPDLTDQSFHALSRRQKLSDESIAEDARDLQALVPYILVECSQGSRDTLKTYPEWDVALFSLNHVGMFRLIRLTHEHGNMRARMRYLREFVTTSQGRLSLDAYIGLIRSRLALVVAAYEDPDNPGFLPTDLIFRAIFMIGLDQTVYERPIQRFNEERPDDTAVEAMVVMQNWYRDVVLANPPTQLDMFLAPWWLA